MLRSRHLVQLTRLDGVITDDAMMDSYRSLDAQVTMQRLRQWPQCPPGLEQRRTGNDGWLRGRPTDQSMTSHPFLKRPGSDRMRTLPDGLWLNFGGTPVDAYVDIFAIESLRLAR